MAYLRPVRFHEADAAGLVFFAHFSTYCHEAMESFFSPLDGGYVGLIRDRRVGFPAVHLSASFVAPLRYGDTARIETSVAAIGDRSATLRYRVVRLGADASVEAARLEHKVVTTDLTTMRSCPMPADVRAQLEQHLDPS